jgi:hypothetical protein
MTWASVAPGEIALRLRSGCGIRKVLTHSPELSGQPGGWGKVLPRTNI